MKVLNFLWHFSTGGIGKCFLTYDQLGDSNPNLKVKSVCVILDSMPCDCQPLDKQGIEQIHIKGNRDFSWMTRMREIVKEERPDAFFCHGHNGPIVIGLLKLRYGIATPLICTCHGVNLDVNKKVNYFIEWIWMKLYKSNIVHKIICVEKYTPPVLISKGVPENRIVTVYNGIDSNVKVNLIDLSKANQKPVIVTVSRLTRIKGLNYLIEALSILKSKGIDFFYYCIGDGDEELSLRNLAKNEGLTEEDVDFVGYQNNIPDWLSACDIFALPSLEEFHSIAILEAMRSKKAIVATNIGGNPESLRDELDALLVPSMDSVALANALERLLTSSELRNQLANSAYERFVNRFTIDVMKNNLVREILSAK